MIHHQSIEYGTEYTGARQTTTANQRIHHALILTCVSTSASTTPVDRQPRFVDVIALCQGSGLRAHPVHTRTVVVPYWISSHPGCRRSEPAEFTT